MSKPWLFMSWRDSFWGSVSLLLGFILGGGLRRPWRDLRQGFIAWRFRRRWPIGTNVVIIGSCCERKFAGRIVEIKRHYFSDRWEVRFDLGSDAPYGCCGNGMRRAP
jgi:hypothetical protein